MTPSIPLLPPDPSSSRRELLAAGASLGCFGLAALAVTPASTAALARADEPESRPGEALDRAYERIGERFPDVDIHRSNHAAMVAEALCTLGQGAAIAPWLDRNLAPLQRDPRPLRALDAERWRQALADEGRYADWQALFLAELAHDDWRVVLRRWVPRLAPGLAGAATHGLIRTAHGARALAALDSEPRRRELATGLAYWATTYQELPADGSSAPEKSVADALARLELRRPALEPPRGNIVDGLSSLLATPSFRAVAGLVDPRDPARTLSEITSAFAGLYLRNPERRIAYTHSITAPSAFRLLLPHVDEETAVAGARLAWQAAAGIHVVYGDPRGTAPAARALDGREALVARAVANGDAHAIKLCEAALREHALSHDDTLLAAAQDLAEAG